MVKLVEYILWTDVMINVWFGYVYQFLFRDIFVCERGGLCVQRKRILRVLLSLHGSNKKSVIVESSQHKKQWQDFILIPSMQNLCPRHHIWLSSNANVASEKKRGTSGRTVINSRGRTRQNLKIWVHFLTGSLTGVQDMRKHKTQPDISRKRCHLPRVCMSFSIYRQ